MEGRTGKLSELIIKDFGSLDGFKTKVNTAAAGIQGSGWAWVVRLLSAVSSGNR